MGHAKRVPFEPSGTGNPCGGLILFGATRASASSLLLEVPDHAGFEGLHRFMAEANVEFEDEGDGGEDDQLTEIARKAQG